MTNTLPHRFTIVMIILISILSTINIIFTSQIRNNLIFKQPNSQIILNASSTTELNSITPITMPQNYQKSMFSWYDDPYKIDNKATFYSVLESLDISRVYQKFSDNMLYSDDSKNFIQDAKKMNIDVYYLAGSSEWGIEQDAHSMLLAIDKAVAFSKINDGIGGIIFDVEPYLTSDWEQDKYAVMDIFVQNTIAAYNYANSKGIRMIVCIPAWYERSHYENLEKIISQGCDEVAVMNYNRENEISGMEDETALAKKYNKDISCIFEFQEVGKYSLTENQTYYNVGIEQAHQNFETLYENLSYEKMGFAYHYYDYIAFLMNI